MPRGAGKRREPFARDRIRRRQRRPKRRVRLNTARQCRLIVRRRLHHIEIRLGRAPQEFRQNRIVERLRPSGGRISGMDFGFLRGRRQAGEGRRWRDDRLIVWPDGTSGKEQRDCRQEEPFAHGSSPSTVGAVSGNAFWWATRRVNKKNRGVNIKPK